MNAAWTQALLGKQLGEYTLEDCIGHGGFGLVFEVRSTAGAVFAMKVLIPSNDPNAAVEFANEGLLLRRFTKSSSVVTWVDSGTQQVPIEFGGSQLTIPISYHVLVRASGCLDELLLDPDFRNAMSWPERLRLFRHAIRGVHQLHLKYVVHRDLKADNYLVAVRGDHSELRLTDFGRSKDCRQSPSAGPIDYLWGRGHLDYAPPEYLWLQGGSGFDDFRRADLYGLGSVFVEIITGQPMTALAMPPAQDAMEMAMADRAKGVVRDLATLRPQYRRAIDAIVDDVPADIRERVRALLNQLCDPVPVAREPISVPGRCRPREPGLIWLLQQVDILSRRFAVEHRRHRYRRSSNERTA